MKVVPCCTLVILGMSFWKEIGFIHLILGASVYYILIELSAINIVDYLILSKKCSNRGTLTWNSNASPKFDFLHANMKYRSSTTHLKREIYMYLTWFWNSNARISSHLSKGAQMWITSHNPFWRSIWYISYNNDRWIFFIFSITEVEHIILNVY